GVERSFLASRTQLEHSPTALAVAAGVAPVLGGTVKVAIRTAHHCVRPGAISPSTKAVQNGFVAFLAQLKHCALVIRAASLGSAIERFAGISNQPVGPSSVSSDE